MDTKTALHICGVVRGTYNTWLTKPDFVEFYQRVPELAKDFKQEAIQLLRRDNQLEAVMLESKIIAAMKTDLEGSRGIISQSSILRTNLAKEVYSKLMAELDATPAIQAVSWEQRIQNIFQNRPPVEVIEGEGTDVTEQLEAASLPETEHTESQPPQEGEQRSLPFEEETEEVRESVSVPE